MPSDSDRWRWKLRLFASADLVGSTAYKANTASPAPDWVPTFTEFFQGFPSAVASAYQKLPKSAHAELPADRLRPWKFLGDEILFSVELQQHHQAAAHILAFKEALQEFPDGWRRKKLPLNLKGAAWVAGFPITNREVDIPSPDGSSIRDFIGPSIDLGFRVSKFSDERRLVMSADLAMLLLDGVELLEWPRERFVLVLLRRESLKGVIGGEPYPIVFLHMDDGRLNREERLLGVRTEHNWAELKDFLREYIDTRKPRLCRPFIDGDPDRKYGSIPSDFIALRDGMQAEENARGYTDQATRPEPPPSGDPIEPGPPKLAPTAGTGAG